MSVSDNDNGHCVFFFVVFSAKFSHLQNKHADNHFDDCGVKHSCIKTMSHSPKAAIIGINPLCT